MGVDTLPELGRSKGGCTAKVVDIQVCGEGGLAEVLAKETQLGHSIIGPKGMNKSEKRRLHKDSGERTEMEQE